MTDRRARRTVKIHDVALSGVSLEVTFRDVDLRGVCDEEVWGMLEDSGVEADYLQVLQDGREVVVVSPFLSDVARAKEWLEKLTRAIRLMEERLERLEEMEESFSALCGESEL